MKTAFSNWYPPTTNMNISKTSDDHRLLQQWYNNITHIFNYDLLLFQNDAITACVLRGRLVFTIFSHINITYILYYFNISWVNISVDGWPYQLSSLPSQLGNPWSAVVKVKKMLRGTKVTNNWGAFSSSSKVNM